ncbi:MAG: hypothetical protein AAFN10_28105, partial [Bacteroidota bacterium]
AINTKLDRSNTLVQRIESAPMILRQQDQQLDRLAKQVSQFQSTQQDISSHIAFVEYLEEICRQHKVKIVSLPREATQLVEGYSLVEERFSLEGGIHDILKVLHQIEQQDRVGSIAYLSLQRTSLSLFSKRQNVLVGSVALYRLHTQS